MSMFVMEGIKILKSNFNMDQLLYFSRIDTDPDSIYPLQSSFLSGEITPHYIRALRVPSQPPLCLAGRLALTNGAKVSKQRSTALS